MTPRRRATHDAADRVRSAILGGEIGPGEHLPGERNLAERLGVSRLTLRSALARLEAEGLVRPVHGSGTEVLDFRESGGVELIGHLAAAAMEGGVVPLALLRDLLELRRMIATQLLEVVTERGGRDQILELRGQVRRLAAVLDRPDELMAADLTFARTMVRASGNLALELLFNTVVRVIEQHPSLALAFGANASETVKVYDRLLDLVEERDPQRVGKVAHRLLRRLDRRTLDRIAELTGQMDA